MSIKFIIMVNKQGQTRLAQYYETLSIVEKVALEGEIIRKCLARTENQCSFIEYQNYKCVYRRYASLFFIVGVDSSANELATLEFIHALVETLDKYFENVCELDVRYFCVFSCLLCFRFNFHRVVLVPWVSEVGLNRWCDSPLIAFDLLLFVFQPFVQIMFNIERAHFILDEMVMNGKIVETNKTNILKPLRTMDKFVASQK